MADALRLTGIGKSFPGVRALDGVDLAVSPGEVHAVLGENGSGKSTLLGIASGALRPDEGTVEIRGTSLRQPDPSLARALGLATVYQDDSLVRELSVADNLLLGAPAGTSRREPAAAARAQLDRFSLALPPDRLVGDLSPAERQFLEIVKALAGDPQVLLLDEPTATLDSDGVEKLSALIGTLTAAGTAVVYVTHRLPEILALADRVTILRDGRSYGTHAVTPDLSEDALVALMVGGDVESVRHVARPGGAGRADVALEVRGLTGSQFAGVDLTVRRGEIVGLAGAEGNGQREILRAIGGIEEAEGTVLCAGRPVAATPAGAIAAGVVMLSADRAGEAVFPALAVRENITVGTLGRLASAGLISRRREQAEARAMVDRLGIVTPSLEQPLKGLSGGNQQKAVLGRSILAGAKVVLVDEPTQGVDANARVDIYEAMAEQAGQGTAFLVKSSDALELGAICDRVLVVSRGRIVGELSGDQLTEERIVGAFLTARGDRDAAPVAPGRIASVLRRWSTLPVPLLVLLILAIGLYAAAQSAVFLTPLNLRHILLATAPLALVTMAQLNVLLVGGFDISVGSMMSLTVVLASFLVGLGAPPETIALGVLLCLGAGALVGLVNGLVIRWFRINSVITTIAMLSILQGIALWLRPTPQGVVDPGFLGLLQMRWEFIPLSFFVLVALAIAGDWWLYRTRSGLQLRATGFREQAARRNGVRVDWVHVRAFVLSGLLAACAGLMLAAEVGVGHPTVGSTYALTSIAAAVLGGASLAGGRGSFVGALLGALFFTLTVNIIPLLGTNTAVGVIAGGALTLLAVIVYSGWRPWHDLSRLLRPVRDAARPGASA